MEVFEYVKDFTALAVLFSAAYPVDDDYLKRGGLGFGNRARLAVLVDGDIGEDALGHLGWPGLPVNGWSTRPGMPTLIEARPTRMISV